MNKELKEKVESRIEEESSNSIPAKKNNETKLSISFIKTCLDNNRIGDATLYVALHKGKFVYVKNWGRWLYWDGHHWCEDIENLRAMSAVEDVCEEYERLLIESKEEEGSPLFKSINKRLNMLRDVSAREKLLVCTLILRENPMYIEGDELDKQEFLLGCSNGVVDLRTGAMSDGKPEDYLLNYCVTEWKGLEEESPEFLKFLDSSFDGDQEMVDYMLRLLGYGLLGSRDEHIWAIFHGPRGRNGKDTLMKVMMKVLGGRLAIKIPTALLLQQSFQRSSSQPEPDIMALRGAKFAFASEGESNQKIAMGKLKDLTGGSVITARGLQDKLMTSWDQTHFLFFLTNELPRMKSDDDAFWTRLHAIHWPIRFVDKPKDPDERPRDPKVFAKMAAERSGILARLVEGCMDYLKNGLNPPEKVLSYTNEQREQFDDIGQFLQDCCEREDQPSVGSDWTYKVQVSDFVSTLNWWCKKSLGNSYAFSPKMVTQTLEKRGIPSKKSSVMYYLGVSIKEEIATEYQAQLDIENSRKEGKK